MNDELIRVLMGDGAVIQQARVRFERADNRETGPYPTVDIQQFWDAEVRKQRDYHAANLRAKELLIAHLDEQQKATFESNGWFYVKGKSGKAYRVGPGGTNIRRGENQYCVGPEGLPQFDQLLANKLYLEDDDAALIKKANLISGMGDATPFRFFGNVFRVADPRHVIRVTTTA